MKPDNIILEGVCGSIAYGLDTETSDEDIKGIFIVQTALFNWQFKRSKFVKVRSVQVQFRRINSQTENKFKCGKGEVNVVEIESLVAASNSSQKSITLSCLSEGFFDNARAIAISSAPGNFN